MAESSLQGLGRALRLTGYRLVYRAFAGDPLEARADGRFSRQDEGRTTYLSLTRRTAALEVAKRWGTVGVNLSTYRWFEVPARLSRVAGLTDPGTAAALGVSREMC